MFSNINFLINSFFKLGIQQNVYEGHNGHIQCLVAHENLLFSGSVDTTIRIWNIDNSNLIHVLDGHKESIKHLFLSFNDYNININNNSNNNNNTNALLISSARDSIGIWDINNIINTNNSNDNNNNNSNNNNNNKRIKIEKEIIEGYHGDVIWGMKVYQNRYIITGSWDNNINIYDINSKQKIGQCKGHKGGINCIEVEEEVIYSGSSDCKAIAWSLFTGKRIQQYRGHKRSIECLIVKKDTMYTGSADYTVRSWNIKIGYSLNVYRGHRDFVHQIIIHDETLYTASHDTTICLWKAKVEPKVEPRLRSRSGGSVVDFYDFPTLSRSKERTLSEATSRYRTRKYTYIPNNNNSNNNSNNNTFAKRRALSDAAFLKVKFQDENEESTISEYSTSNLSTPSKSVSYDNYDISHLKSQSKDLIDLSTDEESSIQLYKQISPDIINDEKEEEPIILYVDYEDYNPFDSIHYKLNNNNNDHTNLSSFNNSNTIETNNNNNNNNKSIIESEGSKSPFEEVSLYE